MKRKRGEDNKPPQPKQKMSMRMMSELFQNVDYIGLDEGGFALIVRPNGSQFVWDVKDGIVEVIPKSI